MEALATHLGTISWRATFLASASIIVIILFRKYAPRVPAYIVVMILGTTLVAVTGLSVETIGTRFGGIPTGLPSLTIPHFDVGMIGALFPSAMTVALLGAIESLLSAVVSDRMSGDKHDPSVELMAQGIANVASPFVRWHSRHGGDCQNRYECTMRGENPRRRDGSCTYLALCACVCRPFGEIHPAVGTLRRYWLSCRITWASGMKSRNYSS